MKMQIKLFRSQCIGCGSCAAICPNYFEISDDGLSHLKGSTLAGDDEVLNTESAVGCAKEAAEVCPVQIIEIM